jgi:hypothetical protein
MYLCNQCLSPLKLLVRIPLRLDTTLVYCNQWVRLLSIKVWHKHLLYMSTRSLKSRGASCFMHRHWSNRDRAVDTQSEFTQQLSMVVERPENRSSAKPAKHFFVFIRIRWPEGSTSTKSVKHCILWDMLIWRWYHPTKIWVNIQYLYENHAWLILVKPHQIRTTFASTYLIEHNA